LKTFGKIKGDEAHDGPARVVKPGDWNAVPDGSMKGFSLESFSIPGRAQPKVETSEQKIIDLEKKIAKLQVEHKALIEKTIKSGEEKMAIALAQGKEVGMVAGEKAASEKYDQSLQELQTKTQGMLAILEKEKATVFLEFEGQVLELVSNCIHRVFEGIASEHADAVLPLLKKAVASIGEASIITIKVHPEDFQTVEGNKAYWLPINASLKDVRVVVDERINKGSCFVESDSTSVSAVAQEMADRIDEELKKVFLGKLSSLQNSVTPEKVVEEAAPEVINMNELSGTNEVYVKDQVNGKGEVIGKDEVMDNPPTIEPLEGAGP